MSLHLLPRIGLLAFLAVAGAVSVRMSARARQVVREAKLQEAEEVASDVPEPDEVPSSRAAASYAAPWMHPLKKALNHGGTQRNKRDRKEATRKQLQLATVDPATGRPAVRTIVFRGFLPANASGIESSMLTFVTDSRAEKVRHIRETKGGRAPVEVCWWLSEAGVQFRISGFAVLCTHDSQEPEQRKACTTVWERLSDSTRSTFAWPHPGARATPSDGASDKVPTLAEANFCLLVVVPNIVDELHLGGKQKRMTYTLDAAGGGKPQGPWGSPGSCDWRVETVNP